MTRRDLKLFGGFVAVLAVGWLAIFVHFRLPSPPPALSEATRTAVLRAARAALEGAGPQEVTGAGLERAAGGPVFVTVYLDGKAAQRWRGDGPTLAVALRAASPEPLPHREDAARARIAIEIVQGEGPVPTAVPLLFAFGAAPGLDGLVARQNGRELWLTPGELIQRGLLTGLSPFAFMEFEFGLDVPGLELLAERELQVADARGRVWRRFRTESFIEGAAADHAPLPVDRGNTPGPALDRDTMTAAALAGGRYLLDKLRPDGSFEYEYDTTLDEDTSGTYSLPRHFGAAMYLAQLAGATQDARFRDGARRAFGYLDEHKDEMFGYTGSSALAVLALTEYRAVEGDTRFDRILEKLGKLLLARQKPEGDFVHQPGAPKQKDLYVDGEGGLALVRLARTFGGTAYLEGARRALDWLTTRTYSHFAGQFYFGEDHWTCMATEAAWPLIDSPAYQRFCDDYAAFLRRQQFFEGEGPDDFTGAYGFSPFFPPHSTPAASRTEAMISAYLLGRHRGQPDEATRLQVLRSLRYLLAQQIRAENDWLVTCPDRARGGWMQSPLRRFVRIDFVQHAGDALLRGRQLLDD